MFFYKQIVENQSLQGVFMKTLLVVVLGGLIGCTTTMSSEQWESANYGDRLSQSEYVSYIDRSVRGVLIDPTSMRLSCGDARKGWAKKLRGNPQFGWLVYCQVNAKNSLGGYTGNKHYVYLFNGEKLMVVIPNGYAKLGYDFGVKP
jgi:hypothetical protein